MIPPHDSLAPVFRPEVAALNTTAYRYWSLLLHENVDGGTFFVIDEIEFRGTPGSAFNHSGKGTALSDGWYDKTGADTTYWSHNNAFARRLTGATEQSGQAWARNGGSTDLPVNAPHRIGFGFVVDRLIREVWLRASATTALDRYKSMPARFDVQGSHDEINWTTVASFNGIDWTTPGEEQVFAT